MSQEPMSEGKKKQTDFFENCLLQDVAIVSVIRSNRKSEAKIQSYDCELQRQRCKNLQRNE
jgi:hypothetical protein